MKIPIQWLKQYVNIPVSKQDLADKLTMAGLEVVGVIENRGMSIFDIEVTPNRPDLLSLLGVAREVSALFDEKLKFPQNEQLEEAENSLPLEVKIEDFKKCPYYSARILMDVEIGESSTRFKSNLSSVGVREVNNIVDITNFCLFETGQPLHAFDYDKIKGERIIVRQAEEGEKIETIDDEIVELTCGDLIIADREGPIAIAGVIGGKNTEITKDTTNIVLESAYFDPVTIRRTARRLGLSTESSYRFERKVKVDMIEYASRRASNLILNSSPGGRIGEYKEESKNSNLPSSPGIIELSLKKVRDYLDINIGGEKVIKILEKLGVKCELKESYIKVRSPSFRQDLKREIDLIEEVTRIYGYDKIPSKIPLPTKDELLSKANKRSTYEQNSIIRNIFINFGFDEIMTYSLISKEDLSKIGYTADDCVSIKNPLSQYQEVLRPSMLPSILKTINFNIKRGIENLGLFEVGKTYHLKDNSSPQEVDKLVVALSKSEEYCDGKFGDLFYDLKGIIKASLKKMEVREIEFKPVVDNSSVYYPHVEAEIKANNKTVGKIGYILEEICNKFNISNKVAVMQLRLNVLREAMQPGVHQYIPISKYPSSYRDLSIIIDRNVYHSKIANILSSGKNVSSVKFLDQYEGEQIPAGKKSLTYRIIYQSERRTLNDEEIDQCYKKSVKELKDKFNVELR